MFSIPLNGKILNSYLQSRIVAEKYTWYNKQTDVENIRYFIQHLYAILI